MLHKLIFHMQILTITKIRSNSSQAMIIILVNFISIVV